jgi:hypothetical protein
MVRCRGKPDGQNPFLAKGCPLVSFEDAAGYAGGVKESCGSRKLMLLVEDEPLIALDVERDLRTASARVIAAGYLDAALCMTEHPDLSGAVVGLRLPRVPPQC